jgi:hypothetical protein
MTTVAATMLLQLESDRDAGIPGRLLDLLTVQQRLPDRLTIDWHPASISFRLLFRADAALPASLVARLRMIPGVRSVCTAALS